jgi:Hypoxia induced protein conserved region
MTLNAVGFVLAIVAAVVFIFGVYSMVLGGSEDRQHSARMMLTRVEFQAVAIALMALAAYLTSL